MGDGIDETLFIPLRELSIFPVYPPDYPTFKPISVRIFLKS